MNIPFLQAKNFNVANRTVIDLVVIHSAEIGESLEGAEILMRKCAVSDKAASWHYAVDGNSVTQSVREKDIAWHAPGANRTGIGIELTGRAKQSLAEWEDQFSRSMLGLAAQLSADICRRWSIPIAFVDAQGLKLGQRGITTHGAVSAAFKKSTHTDPGPAFPLARFIEMVRTSSLVVPGTS